MHGFCEEREKVLAGLGVYGGCFHAKEILCLDEFFRAMRTFFRSLDVTMINDTRVIRSKRKPKFAKI